MKKASKILYIIGAIAAIVGFVSLLILGISTLAIDNQTLFQMYNESNKAAMESGVPMAQLPTFNDWKEARNMGGITLIVVAAVEAIVACLAFFGFSASLRGSKNKVIHIVNIVFGAISGSVLVLLGGIFGVIAANQAQ